MDWTHVLRHTQQNQSAIKVSAGIDSRVFVNSNPDRQNQRDSNPCNSMLINKFVAICLMPLTTAPRRPIKSQFGYYPLVWMFHSRKQNKRMNKIHERALRILYKGDRSSFELLLQKDCSFTMHERNIQTMAVELYRVGHGLSPRNLKRNASPESNIYCTGFSFESWNLRTVNTIFPRTENMVNYSK